MPVKNTACGVAVLLTATLAATSALAIKCENGYQRVQGNLIATPYCQDQLLAQSRKVAGLQDIGRCYSQQSQSQERNLPLCIQ
jgi:hypothetical protein